MRGKDGKVGDTIMKPPHDFKKQLQFSQAASDEPFWDAVYRKAFPDMANHMVSTGDTLAQRMGIDRIILLSNGRNLRVDEKKREKVYNDILLEFVSNDRTGAAGWIEKPLFIDYLAYAFMPTRKVYLFDWLMLRRAWIYYGETWKKSCRHVPAQNPGYRTISLAVPIPTLQKAVQTAAIIDVSQELLRIENKAS
jgi:hypothetical protein